MSEHEHRERLILDSAIRAAAIREVVAVLLAAQARQSDDPLSFLRRISDGLDRRLTSGRMKQAELEPVEKLREEYDSMMESARLILEETHPPQGSQQT
jgi:hypothetical protein